MTHRKKKIIYAAATLIGTIIGVGMFELPYVAYKAGLGQLLLFLIGLMFLVFAVNLVYSEIIIDCPDFLQLPGYINKYLGRNWGRINFINFLIGMYGSMLVYLIVGGKFIQSIVSPFYQTSFFAAVIIIFFAGSILIYKDVKSIANAEFIMVIFLLAAIFIFFLLSLKKIIPINLFVHDHGNYLIPYGIVLFSFWSLTILPEIKEILLLDNKGKKQLKQDMKTVNFYALFISMAVYVLFVISVLGISGKNTSMEALGGLKALMPGYAIYIGYFLGFLAVFTSYISTGLSIKKSFCFDYKLNANTAAILTCIIPFLLFLFGFTNFIPIINFIGTLTCGISGFFVFILYLEMKKSNIIKKARFSDASIYFFITLFFLGIATLLIN